MKPLSEKVRKTADYNDCKDEDCKVCRRCYPEENVREAIKKVIDKRYFCEVALMEVIPLDNLIKEFGIELCDSQQTKHPCLDNKDGSSVVHTSAVGERDKTADTLRGCGKLLQDASKTNIAFYCGDYFDLDDNWFLCSECQTRRKEHES